MYQNQGYDYYPTEPYYDPNQQYYDDPNQQYYDPNQQYYDPYTNQYYDSGYDDTYEETDSAVLRREQERVEAIESNRLYLKKIRKQCVREDFSDLEKRQLFLFEIIIESLEINSESDLGLTGPPGEGEEPFVIVQAQFLNSPFLEIRHNGEASGSRYGTYNEYNDYVQAVGEYRLSAIETTPSKRTPTPSNAESQSRSSNVDTVDSKSAKLAFDTKWEDGNGKSCLFSMAAMEMIRNLDKYPVKIQVDRGVVKTVDDDSVESREPLGYTSIRLPDEFAMAVLQSLKPEVVMPVTSMYRQTCDVHNVFGVKKGRVDVSIRLSAFGPVIITSVQMVDGERRYAFQPRPMVIKDEEKEEQVNRSDVLKPLMSEQDDTIKATASYKGDLFQKPIMWKSSAQQCRCLESSFSKKSILKSSEFDRNSLSKLPLSSDINLCRDATPHTKQDSMRKTENDLCDWHNLVGLEVKNNPECYCECFIEGGDNCWKSKDDLLKKLNNLRKPYQPLPPIAGTGLKPEPTDCGCDCPAIREALKRQTPSYRG